MTMLTRLRFVTGATLAALALLAGTDNPAAAQDSTWKRISDTGILRVGVIPNRAPYYWQENGQWVGFSAEMGRDAAEAVSKGMGKPIKVEFVLTNFTTVVLDMQANKLDIFFGMTISEERKKALHMIGPMWYVPNVAVNAANFDIGDKWESYSKPEVKVSVVMGSTDEEAARNYMPKATIRSMKDTAIAVLDVQSGNANAWVTTVLTGLGAMKENPNLAKLVLLQPVLALPSGAGTRRDSDGKFAAYMQEWSQPYREGGMSQKRMFEAMTAFGLDVGKLPKDVKF